LNSKSAVEVTQLMFERDRGACNAIRSHGASCSKHFEATCMVQ